MQETQDILTDAQLERYGRHVILDMVGEEGQVKLLRSKVLVIGAGGLGSPVLLYLAAAGVGTLGVIDHDTVESSNLQRQIIHSEDTVDDAKTTSAKNRLLELNSDITVQTYRERLTKERADAIFPDYDVIVDGSDNFTTRYCVNATAVHHKKPLVSGAVSRFEGQLTTIDVTRDTPCYRCIFPVEPSMENVSQCDTVGIFGTTTGIIGTMQASEVLKILLGIGAPLYGQILLADTLHNTFKTFSATKNKTCSDCS